MNTADLATLVTAIGAAIAGVVAAWRATQARNETRTNNDKTIGRLASDDETRRVEAVPNAERTAAEQHHLDTSPREPGR